VEMLDTPLKLNQKLQQFLIIDTVNLDRVLPLILMLISKMKTLKSSQAS
jgi:hypothetical protein